MGASPHVDAQLPPATAGSLSQGTGRPGSLVGSRRCGREKKMPGASWSFGSPQPWRKRGEQGIDLSGGPGRPPGKHLLAGLCPGRWDLGDGHQPLVSPQEKRPVRDQQSLPPQGHLTLQLCGSKWNRGWTGVDVWRTPDARDGGPGDVGTGDARLGPFLRICFAQKELLHPAFGPSAEACLQRLVHAVVQRPGLAAVWGFL